MAAKHVICANYVSRLDPPAFYLFMGQSQQSVPIPIEPGITVSFRDDNGWTALAFQWTGTPPAGLTQYHIQRMVREAAQHWVLHLTLTAPQKTPAGRPHPQPPQQDS